VSLFVCYQENSDRYPAINEAQQTIPNGQYRSTWNEKAVFFFTSLGFTTGNWVVKEFDARKYLTLILLTWRIW